MADTNALAVIHQAALVVILDAAVERAVERAVRRTFASLIEGTVVDDEWITPKVATKLYGRHRSTLARWSKAGILPTRQLGGSVYYGRHAVARLAGQSQTGS